MALNSIVYIYIYSLASMLVKTIKNPHNDTTNDFAFQFQQKKKNVSGLSGCHNHQQSKLVLYLFFTAYRNMSAKLFLAKVENNVP